MPILLAGGRSRSPSLARQSPRSQRFRDIAVLLALWALRPVEQTWRSQRQFIADASHELKTPLTVILADASIALEHPDRTVESQRQWIEGIQVEGQRMQGLVEDMLTLAGHDTAGVDAQATMGKQQESSM